MACAVFVLAAAQAAAIVPAGAGEAGPAVTIVSPRNEQTIHDNSGRVPVQVSLSDDALRSGGALRVELDGRIYGPPRRASSFALEGVVRGQHELRIALLDPSGNAIASSEPVTFYMWQASALFPGRKKQ